MSTWYGWGSQPNQDVRDRIDRMQAEIEETMRSQRQERVLVATERRPGVGCIESIKPFTIENPDQKTDHDAIILEYMAALANRGKLPDWMLTTTAGSFTLEGTEDFNGSVMLARTDGAKPAKLSAREMVDGAFGDKYWRLMADAKVAAEEATAEAQAAVVGGPQYHGRTKADLVRHLLDPRSSANRDPAITHLEKVDRIMTKAFCLAAFLRIDPQYGFRMLPGADGADVPERDQVPEFANNLGRFGQFALWYSEQHRTLIQRSNETDRSWRSSQVNLFAPFVRQAFCNVMNMLFGSNYTVTDVLKLTLGSNWTIADRWVYFICCQLEYEFGAYYGAWGPLLGRMTRTVHAIEPYDSEFGKSSTIEDVWTVQVDCWASKPLPSAPSGHSAKILADMLAMIDVVAVKPRFLSGAAALLPSWLAVADASQERQADVVAKLNVAAEVARALAQPHQTDDQTASGGDLQIGFYLVDQLSALVIGCIPAILTPPVWLLLNAYGMVNTYMTAYLGEYSPNILVNFPANQPTTDETTYAHQVLRDAYLSAQAFTIEAGWDVIWDKELTNLVADAEVGEATNFLLTSRLMLEQLVRYRLETGGTQRATPDTPEGLMYFSKQLAFIINEVGRTAAEDAFAPVSLDAGAAALEQAVQDAEQGAEALAQADAGAAAASAGPGFVGRRGNFNAGRGPAQSRRKKKATERQLGAMQPGFAQSVMVSSAIQASKIDIVRGSKRMAAETQKSWDSVLAANRAFLASQRATDEQRAAAAARPAPLNFDELMARTTGAVARPVEPAQNPQDMEFDINDPDTLPFNTPGSLAGIRPAVLTAGFTGTPNYESGRSTAQTLREAAAAGLPLDFDPNHDSPDGAGSLHVIFDSARNQVHEYDRDQSSDESESEPPEPKPLQFNGWGPTYRRPMEEAGESSEDEVEEHVEEERIPMPPRRPKKEKRRREPRPVAPVLSSARLDVDDTAAVRQRDGTIPLDPWMTFEEFQQKFNPDLDGMMEHGRSVVTVDRQVAKERNIHVVSLSQLRDLEVFRAIFIASTTRHIWRTRSRTGDVFFLLQPTAFKLMMEVVRNPAMMTSRDALQAVVQMTATAPWAGAIS